jgi:hypothetical protein
MRFLKIFCSYGLEYDLSHSYLKFHCLVTGTLYGPHQIKELLPGICLFMLQPVLAPGSLFGFAWFTFYLSIPRYMCLPVHSQLHTTADPQAPVYAPYIHLRYVANKAPMGCKTWHNALRSVNRLVRIYRAGNLEILMKFSQNCSYTSFVQNGIYRRVYICTYPSISPVHNNNNNLFIYLTSSGLSPGGSGYCAYT